MADVVSLEFDGKTLGLTPLNLSKTMTARFLMYMKKVYILRWYIMVTPKTSRHPSYPMLLHSYFFLYRILFCFLSLTRVFLSKEICFDPKQMVSYHKKHPYSFLRLPPTNIFDPTLSRSFTNKLSIFPISFPTFHRPFKRIRELWVPDHLFLVIGLMKTRHQKKKEKSADRRPTDMCSIKKKNTLQILESKTRRTNMESKQDNYRMQK